MNDSSASVSDCAARCECARGVRIAWLAPVIFLVHDLEETLQAERMNALAAGAERRLPEPIARRVPRLHYTRRGMAYFTVGALAAQVGLTVWSRRSRRAEQALSLVLLFRFLNGASHLGQSITLRRYVPGVATSPIIMAAAGVQLGALRRSRCEESA